MIILRQEDKEKLDNHGLMALTDYRHMIRMDQRLANVRKSGKDPILDDTVYGLESRAESLVFRALVRFLEKEETNAITVRQILNGEGGIGRKLKTLTAMNCPWTAKEEEWGRPLHKETVRVMNNLLTQALPWVGTGGLPGASGNS